MNVWRRARSISLVPKPSSRHVRRALYAWRTEWIRAMRSLKCATSAEISWYDRAMRRCQRGSQVGHCLVYDSLYAALADLRQCELWTAHTRFYRVVKADVLFVKHIAECVCCEVIRGIRRHYFTVGGRVSIVSNDWIRFSSAF